MIACFQEMHCISRNFGADFDEVVNMLADIQALALSRRYWRTVPHFKRWVASEKL